MLNDTEKYYQSNHMRNALLKNLLELQLDLGNFFKETINPYLMAELP